MKTEKAIAEFMISRGGLRPRTQREYQNHLALFEKSFQKLPKKPEPIQAWLNSFRRQRGNLGQDLTPETIHARFRTVRAFYRQIHQWHPNVVNPMSLVRPPSLLPKAMRTFTGEELYRVFNLPLTLRDRTMVTLLLDTGIRAQECVLIWDNVWLDYIIVNGKTGERIVPIHETTSFLLQRLKVESNHSRYVFQGERGPLCYEGIYKAIRSICHRANIDGKRCSPHSFRHTFGSEYASSASFDPKVLQDIMGHRDFKTTLRYIHNNRRRLIENHRLCTPLRLVAAATQGALFSQDLDTSQAVKEAEEILTKKGAEDYPEPWCKVIKDGKLVRYEDSTGKAIPEILWPR
ncbi:MAG: site-specific integrase [Desulfobacterales bacterium]|nr:site-specific integrase [Desulfobacterales bacterium]